MNDAGLKRRFRSRYTLKTILTALKRVHWRDVFEYDKNPSIPIEYITVFVSMISYRLMKMQPATSN
jgi:hypothetical protein